MEYSEDDLEVDLCSYLEKREDVGITMLASLAKRVIPRWRNKLTLSFPVDILKKRPPFGRIENEILNSLGLGSLDPFDLKNTKVKRI
jgi:hypothetical protein